MIKKKLDGSEPSISSQPSSFFCINSYLLSIPIIIYSLNLQVNIDSLK